MKKILLVIVMFLTLCGCNIMDMNNTPKKQVEKFFNGYQTLDKNVLESLDAIVNKETTLSTEQKNKYRDLLKKHYQDLDYNIKEETINGDSASVKVEIEVTDYSKLEREIEEKRVLSREEFFDETNTYSESKFQDYRLERLKDNKDRVKYTLYLSLTKVDNKWTLDAITETDEEKILGIYEY